MFKLDLEKAEEPESKLPTSAGSTLALLTMQKPLTDWTILQEMGIPDQLTCLLRNLYAGQDTTVRTGHGTIDWFQTGKGVCKGCLLSPCLLTYMQSIS